MRRRVLRRDDVPRVFLTPTECEILARILETWTTDEHSNEAIRHVQILKHIHTKLEKGYMHYSD